MAEMIGVSQCTGPQNGVAGRLVSALKRGLSRLARGSRSSRLRLDEWPDYLLRDIGLDSTLRDQAEPRGKPTDFLMR